MHHCLRGFLNEWSAHDNVDIRSLPPSDGLNGSVGRKLPMRVMSAPQSPHECCNPTTEPMERIALATKEDEARRTRSHGHSHS